MGQRARWLAEMECAVSHHGDQVALRRLLLQLLWELPPELPLGVATFMLRRTLPVYEWRIPGHGEPRRVLDDTAGWILEDKSRWPEPDGVETGIPGAANFLDGVMAREVAERHRSMAPTLVSACEYAVAEAITARADNVWAADDPDTADLRARCARLDWEAERGGREFHAEDAFNPSEMARLSDDTSNNVASVAVTKREWVEAVAWLRAHGVDDMADVRDAAWLARVLEVWEHQEGELILSSSPVNHWRAGD